MPNNVTNKLTAAGAPDKVKSFFAAVKGGLDGDGRPIYMDFEKIKPMPDALRVECGSRNDEALKLYTVHLKETAGISEISSLLGEKNTDATKRLFERLQSEYIKPNPNDSELLAFGEQLFNNIRKHGAPTWYEWSIQNWGTKWNAYSQTRIDGNTIQFDTAWSDVRNLMRELSERHPGVTLSYKFAEEQWGLHTGIFEYKAGECLYEHEPPGHSEDANAIAEELLGSRPVYKEESEPDGNDDWEDEAEPDGNDDWEDEAEPDGDDDWEDEL